MHAMDVDAVVGIGDVGLSLSVAFGKNMHYRVWPGFKKYSVDVVMNRSTNVTWQQDLVTLDGGESIRTFRTNSGS